jgi:superfamily II DNA or RNA helicase
MSLTLRPYQQDLIQGVRRAMLPDAETGRPGYNRIAACLGQGGGKSVIISAIAASAAEKGTKTLVISHRDKILKQNFKKIEMVGIKAQIVNGANKKIPESNLVVGMSQSIGGRCTPDEKYPDKPVQEWRDWLLSFRLVLVDELQMGLHDCVLDLVHPDATVVGLSGTILRNGNGQKQLGLYYDCIVKGISNREMIELRYLVPSKCYTLTAPPLDDIPITRSTGDYHQASMQARFNNGQRYGDVIKEWRRLAGGTRTVIFTSGAEHCISLCSALNREGIKAKYVLSKKYQATDKEMSGPRERVLQDFEDGKFTILVSVQTLNVGWDSPSLQTVVLDFATQSWAMYSQSAMRGSRPYPGKDSYTVLDFGNHLRRFGPPEDGEKNNSLWHNTTSPGPALVKQCPDCQRLVLISTKKCMFCGHEWLNIRERYEVELEQYLVDQEDSLLTFEQWVAKKVKTDRWSNQRILVHACIANPGNEYHTFLRTIELLRKNDGGSISKFYWKWFNKEILSKKKFQVKK